MAINSAANSEDRFDGSQTLGAMMFDMCRPDGSHARLTVLLATIENGHQLLIRACAQGYSPARVAGLCMEEYAKVVNAAELYRQAAGLRR